MPKKPIKWGIKCFNLADTMGYVLRHLTRQYLSLPQPVQVVMHLLDQGRHMFTDR